jgi:hypothetical protein
MLHQDFEQLKDFILARNNYFNKGYANAFKDTATNAVCIKQGGDMQVLLPNDTLGNYCYLRSDQQLKYEAQFVERATDNNAQRLTFTDTVTVYLVAIVKDADPHLLLQNLRNTVMMYTALNVVPVAGNYNREQVVAEELSRMKHEDVSAALQRLKDETIIKLTLSVSKSFIPSNCITPLPPEGGM